MPIYEYQCIACGHEEEFFQKVADAPLKKCPACGKNKLKKVLSSTAFQLKGEGWYVTDFRDKHKKDTNEKKPEAKTKATESVASSDST